MAAPDLEKIVDCLNDLQRRGIIGVHAIGGAFAFIFYAEPINTAAGDHPPAARTVEEMGGVP